MSLSPILTSFSRDTIVWLAVTLVLGGAAASAAGRALARAWRGRSRAVFYAAIIAAASGFLCYALFQVSAIPMQAIAAAVSARDVPRLASLLSVWAASFVILSGFATVAWRLTRTRMMALQYGFLTRPDALAQAPADAAPPPDLQADLQA